MHKILGNEDALASAERKESGLSDLELGILHKLADDIGHEGICAELGLSEHVFAACVDNAMKVFGTSTLAGTIARAIRDGLIA